MGYILPISCYQYMQYSNRVDFRSQANNNHNVVKATTSISSVSLLMKNEEHPYLFKQIQHSHKNISSITVANQVYERKSSQIPYITGKGMIIDAMV